ncbi:hypothetical protein [Chitinophaga tropicalis]|uniref:Uncharacterized protein n=1 Tax=Chitinophaga tropicalis TaxID=2683588 RepID=A0A7K1U024_9BACT|nr:hypothetical protein [Chitinophaga tropicalis]MVT07721.1 hypothetical protein [Chitinophaga tropicalis]
MQKKEVIKELFECLTPTMTAAGFNADQKNQFFLKDTESALFNYDIRFYDRTVLKTGEKGFLVEPVAYVHVKAVEAIYQQITLNKHLKKPTQFITIGAALADLNANPDGIAKKINQSFDLLVFEKKDITLVCNALKEIFERLALPYFQAHHNVNAIDAVLNKKPDKESIHMVNERYRIVKGLIAAKLAGNSNYTRLVEAYAKEIKKHDMTEETVEEFQKVQSLLAGITSV